MDDADDVVVVNEQVALGQLIVDLMTATTTPGRLVVAVGSGGATCLS